jgi:hypothetical protein
VPDPTVFLKAAGRVSGLLHVDVQNHESLVSSARKARHRSEYGAIQPPFHLMAYTPQSLSNVLDRCGFEVVQCVGIRNDDAVLGQLFTNRKLLNRLVYATSHQLGIGSLMMAIAKRVAAA